MDACLHDRALTGQSVISVPQKSRCSYTLVQVLLWCVRGAALWRALCAMDVQREGS